MKQLIIFIVFLALSQAAVEKVDQTQLWYHDQLVNHDLPTSNSTYSQRYWVIDEFYKPETGPVLLYICGEYTCPGLPESRLWPADIAQMYGGLILVLEHRYYGLSMPFGDDSLKFENLYLLTLDQALADLAQFISWVKTTGQHKVSTTSPWITIGGSYPGAMSAWFRYKYPHLTVGAIASSAVINSILDFTQFDEQIRTSALKSSPECAQAIHDLNQYAQDQISNPFTFGQYKKNFNATNVSDGQFLYYYADIFVELIQYGSRTELCSELEGNTVEQNSQIVIDYVNKEGISPYDYSSYYLKDDTFDPENPQSSRQWLYQYCTQFGWFQTSPQPQSQSMRSALVDLPMFQELCAESFLNKDIWPTVEQINLDYGALDMEAHNIVLTNGNEDPWKWAGMLESNDDNMIAIQINCIDCAHCVDLYTPTDEDSSELKQARQVELNEISRWIFEYNKKKGTNYQTQPSVQDYITIM